MLIVAAFRSADERQLCGYATAEFHPGVFFQIRDMAVLPADADAIPALINAVASEGQRVDIPPVGRVFLPYEPAMDAALARVFGATIEHGQNQGDLMARTIGAQFTNQQLEALFAAPEAIFSCIDLF